MKRKTLLLILLPFLATLVAGLYLRFGPGNDKAPALPAGPIIVTDTTVYTARPLDRSEINKPILPVALPPDAANIQFAQYAEWQAQMVYVTFHAPLGTCTAYAQALLADHNRTHPTRRVPADLRPINLPPRKADCQELPITWFVPETIQTGLQGGDLGSHRPRIWIDSGRGIFYYQYTDCSCSLFRVSPMSLRDKTHDARIRRRTGLADSKGVLRGQASSES